MKTHFQRKEIKYYLSKKQASDFVNSLGSHLVFDAFCPTGEPYHISSIYYDTSGYDVIRRSVDKPKYKAKLRIRTYENNTHFLELKQKYRGTVYKKRIQLSAFELKGFINDYKLPQRSDYKENVIINDIQTFIDNHAPLLRPVHIEYHRVAYIYRPQQENVRITIDSKLRVFEKTEKCWVKIIPDDYVLMEIKAVGSLPLTLVKSLSHHQIYQTSFSKYGKYFEKRLEQGAIKYV